MACRHDLQRCPGFENAGNGSRYCGEGGRAEPPALVNGPLCLRNGLLPVPKGCRTLRGQRPSAWLLLSLYRADVACVILGD